MLRPVFFAAVLVFVFIWGATNGAHPQQFQYDPKAAQSAAVKEQYCREVVRGEFSKCVDSAIFIGLNAAKIRDHGQLSMFTIKRCQTYIGLLNSCPPNEPRETKARKILAIIHSKIDNAIAAGQPRAAPANR